MACLSSISDTDLLARVPVLLTRERAATAELIAYLAEIDRRRLYLEQACSSLRAFCIERLGYSEDEASKRVRVAQLVRQLPGVLDELRSGAIHLTGLFLLGPYLTRENAAALLAEARGLSRQRIEQLIARWFPKPDVESRIDPVTGQPALPLGEQGAPGSGRPAASTCPGTDSSLCRANVEPLSASRFRVQFTAREELHAKIQQAQELLSQTVTTGDLAALFERALDALIEQEVRRRRGAGSQRKRRVQKPGSRHVPVEVADAVWQRDAGQCTFVDAQGRRCSARHFFTLEHIEPHAFGGPPTVENICLLCASHNAYAARQVIGEAHIENRRREQTERTVCSALSNMGFRKHEALQALTTLRASPIEPGTRPLLRAALALMVPVNVSSS